MSLISGADIDSIAQSLGTHLAEFVPELERRYKAELILEINALKKAKDAVILGHNYMEPAVYHGVTDFHGDSLELARAGRRAKQNTIVFCGVEFMAETAKILSPEKTVLMPSTKAGCSLAASITANDVRALRAKYPGVPVVSYVNTYADVKAESDVCVTSSNAARIVEKLDQDTIIFLPDEYLAKNVAKDTGKHIILPTVDPLMTSRPAGAGVERVLVGWHGKCEVHEAFSVEDVAAVRRQFPQAVVLAHPECSPEVVAVADFSGSTSKMIDYVRDTKAENYLLLTECSMGDNIIVENPEKNLLRLCSVRCPHMGQITLENIRDSLLHDRYEIEIPEEIRLKAERALVRMLELS